MPAREGDRHRMSPWRLAAIIAVLVAVIGGSYWLGLRRGVLAQYLALFAVVAVATAAVYVRGRIVARRRPRDPDTSPDDDRLQP